MSRPAQAASTSGKAGSLAEDDVTRLLLYHDLQVGEDNLGTLVHRERVLCICLYVCMSV